MHPSCAAKIPKLSGIIYNLTLIRWVTGGRKHSTQVYWGNAKVGLGDCEGRRKGEEGEQHLWLKRWGWRSEKERRSADQRYARWGKQQKVGGADMQQGQTHKPHSLIYVVVTLFTLYSRWGSEILQEKVSAPKWWQVWFVAPFVDTLYLFLDNYAALSQKGHGKGFSGNVFRSTQQFGLSHTWRKVHLSLMSHMSREPS